MKTQAIKYLNGLITENTTKKEIDLIEFIKRCVKDTKEKEELPKVDITPFFDKLYGLYGRKVNKQLALKTFEHKVRGLTEEECKEKCNQIYKLQMARQKQWEQEGRQKQYYPHYSSWLNAEVPNSPHFKGR